jgi:methyltransferase (TIGR00027 family)
VELPDLSNSMYVAGLRYIQTVHESLECQNPDSLVRHFIPIFKRWRTAWLGRETLSKLRADPFYYYLMARTRYYDQVIDDAVSNGVRYLVSVGCGSDTRAYRFKDLLQRSAASVLECDQAKAIQAKQLLARRWGRHDYVQYMAIDLNDDRWPALERELQEHAGSKTLVLMEGVSPYVDEKAFARFLDLLAATLASGSTVAYDFKLIGVNDGFGRVGRTLKPFRLSSNRDEVAAYHEARGLRLEAMELSADLCTRLVPTVARATTSPFEQDCLVRLRTGGALS